MTMVRYRRRRPVALALLAPFAMAIAALAPAAAPASAATRVIELVTPAGFRVWMVREASIPIVSVEIAFRGGSELDPPGKEGLSRMAAALMDEGAGEYDGLAFQRRLEEFSVSLSFSAERDTFRVSLRTLSENRDEAFRLLGVALGAPRFEASAVERIRGQLLADVSRRNEDSDFIAAKTWYAKAFPEHPYGRSSRGEPETIRAITVADLHAFAAARFARGEVMIGAVGDIEPAALGALIDRSLAALPPPAAATAVAVADVSVRTPGSLTVIRRKSPQSRVFLGLPGVKRSDPDYYAAYVMNYVLGGGGFTSRLYQEVREKRGLAYSVYSYLTTFRHAGLVMGGFATVNDRVAEALNLYKQEIARLAADGISEAELTDAKTYLTGSFPLRLDSNAKIAGNLLGMQVEGLGIDFLDKRNDYINAVTIADVRRVASRILKLDDMTVVVVGDPQGLAP